MTPERLDAVERHIAAWRLFLCDGDVRELIAAAREAAELRADRERLETERDALAGALLKIKALRLNPYCTVTNDLDALRAAEVARAFQAGQVNSIVAYALSESARNAARGAK